LDFTREPRRPDFYLISGFLMAMILNGKYADTPHGNWLFLYQQSRENLRAVLCHPATNRPRR
jgi:hypothetical protein